VGSKKKNFTITIKNVAKSLLSKKKKKMSTKKLNNKLNYKKLQLYKIKKVKKLLNYKLNLLKNIDIYLVFYVILLEKALLNVLLVLKPFFF
jgi:hypothetical protein